MLRLLLLIEDEPETDAVVIAACDRCVDGEGSTLRRLTPIGKRCTNDRSWLPAFSGGNIHSLNTDIAHGGWNGRFVVEKMGGNPGQRLTRRPALFLRTRSKPAQQPVLSGPGLAGLRGRCFRLRQLRRSCLCWGWRFRWFFADDLITANHRLGGRVLSRRLRRNVALAVGKVAQIWKVVLRALQIPQATPQLFWRTQDQLISGKDFAGGNRLGGQSQRATYRPVAGGCVVDRERLRQRHDAVIPIEEDQVNGETYVIGRDPLERNQPKCSLAPRRERRKMFAEMRGRHINERNVGAKRFVARLVICGVIARSIVWLCLRPFEEHTVERVTPDHRFTKSFHFQSKNPAKDDRVLTQCSVVQSGAPIHHSGQGCAAPVTLGRLPAVLPLIC